MRIFDVNKKDPKPVVQAFSEKLEYVVIPEQMSSYQWGNMFNNTTGLQPLLTLEELGIRNVIPVTNPDFVQSVAVRVFVPDVEVGPTSVVCQFQIAEQIKF